ncbi:MULTISPECIES: putative bifunctional diguanylate cyclase/phosphodiesterase [unclassified Solwaraspora]|uniref:putative bifunctional diguanylate cyclase/phosphodiesterase n=1 Tax=unclassified Solwaraspora TaxID=2627926 RepID=UPI00259B5C70|nr:EAL domain-containing protein [Solwaraspora sp. WMMA2056]WJK39468.1 EAL domain-containing protein [Solwaraspora sp. WMMA2056]
MCAGAIVVRPAAPGTTRACSSLPALALLVVGAVAAVLYGVVDSPLIHGSAFVVAGVGGAAAVVVGPRWHGARPRLAWALLAAACVCFLTGALARPWAVGQDGTYALAADAATVPGYLFMLLGLAGLLRTRGRLPSHAVIDGLIVFIGAALCSVLLLAVPAGSITGRPALVSALAALYPIFDVILVLLLVSLAFTTAARRASYLLLVASMSCLLLGDVLYAIIGVSGQLTGSRLLDLPFLVGFLLIGAAALHPSVVELGRAAPLPVQAWSWQRLLLIGPALAAPFLLTVFVSGRSATDRLVLGVGGAAMVVLLMMRAVSAVQGYAAAQRRYEHRATHDPLTGLPNRLMLAAEVRRLLTTRPANRTWIWVFFLDLDGFKLVNDSWGHHAGDQLIAEVAGRLRAALPPAAMVARVGGDEFVVVHLGDRSDALTVADRIIDCVNTPLQIRQVEAVITASVGIAGTELGPAGVRADPPVSADALLRDADTAMYQAKADGRGRWVMFDASMHERVRERVDIEQALRTALAQDDLRLAYQPIVDLESGALIGAEALLRWEHPERGPVSPAVFIPMAEDTGLIGPIGRWVLDRALHQVAQWRADGTVDADFWMSINVSPRQLRDPGLSRALDDCLARYDVPASAVVLEITESVMIDPTSATGQVLSDLRQRGIRIVVDDFGTGFSALGYLRSHPVTGVKVDRAFVAGLGASAKDEEIVRAVVAMSSALHLTVVAEGVETPLQQSVLAVLGVLYGQGRLWGEPVEPQEFVHLWSAEVGPAEVGRAEPMATAEPEPMAAAEPTQGRGGGS